MKRKEEAVGVEEKEEGMRKRLKIEIRVKNYDLRRKKKRRKSKRDEENHQVQQSEFKFFIKIKQFKTRDS